MVKKLLYVFFAVLICFAMSVTAYAEGDAKRLYDGADLLTDSEENNLLRRLDNTSEKYKVDIVIATTNTLDGYYVDEYASFFYDVNNYGYGERRNGVLLFIDMEGRNYHIVTNGLGSDAISNGDIDFIGDEISPLLTNGDYVMAFNKFVDECEYEINGEINGFPFSYLKNIIIALVIGFIVAFIVTTVMRCQLKSVKRQPDATKYTKPDSMQVTVANDLFLYRTVSRIRRQKNSSGGGGSRNMGGGKF